MKIFHLLLSLLFAFFMCFSACGEGGDEPIEPTPKPEVVETEIVIDSCIVSHGLSLSAAGGELSVSFSVNADWTLSVASITSGETWCKASATNGSEGSATVKFTVTENTSEKERSTFVTIKAGTVSKMFTITQMGYIETDYVDLQFDKQNVLTRYNESDGSLTVTYPSGNLPKVKEGNSIVLPAEYGFDIRVIVSASVSGNTLRLKTSQGNMTNLFRNISFTLTTDPEVASRTSDSEVYTPMAYGYLDETGEYHEIYNEAIDSRDIISVENNFWEFNKSFDGENIYSGKVGTLSWKKCEFYAGLKGTFTFDFGEKEINGKLPVGDLRKFSYKLTGSIGMDLLLHYYYKYEYKEENDEIINYNVIPTGVLRFIVGTVPVVILVYTHLGQQYGCFIEGSLDATAGVKIDNEVSIGLEWTPGNGVVPINEVIPYWGFYPLTVKAQASAEAKVSYYPQVEIGIYKFLGPWFEPRSYLKESVEAGLRASTNGKDYVAWKAETYNGMDIRMGLKMDFGFWDKEVWTSDIYNCVEDRLLFEAPSRITALSPENKTKVEKGESVTAEFLIESFSPITNKYYPCPWALVNFEPECGELDKPLAVTDMEGKANVNWIPNPDYSKSVQSRSEDTVERKLAAKVVDKEGKSIDEAVLLVETDDSEDSLRDALIKLYKCTNGDNWIRNDNWCSDRPITEWYGVDIDPIGKICNIILGSNGLVGKIDNIFPDDTVISLDVRDNQLTSIDLSGCTALVFLECESNKLTQLDLSGCTEMVVLVCNNNQLTQLNISGCTAMKELYCKNNQLTVLDVSGFTVLERLNCSNNQLTSLGVSGCIALKDLYFGDYLFTSLDVSGCIALEELYGLDHVTSLNASNCISLKEIYPIKQLSSLNLSGCTALTELFCISGQLTSLDVSGCIALEKLVYTNNQLISLDASGCTALKELNCCDNQITSLNVSGCTALEALYCTNNQITSVIPEWFSQFAFIYDRRYEYYLNYDNFEWTYKDNGKGWWYPGEPEDRH